MTTKPHKNQKKIIVKLDLNPNTYLEKTVTTYWLYFAYNFRSMMRSI